MSDRERGREKEGERKKRELVWGRSSRSEEEKREEALINTYSHVTDKLYVREATEEQRKKRKKGYR